ncbi:hypothetical protein B0H10DRAFT_1952884 [Mycena sp. CBHHK59/15]|nr:hypothetical protein B0H10DRAFT_1952884 [Mycena sp. CBHHK59/15]
MDVDADGTDAYRVLEDQGQPMRSSIPHVSECHAEKQAKTRDDAMDGDTHVVHKRRLDEMDSAAVALAKEHVHHEKARLEISKDTSLQPSDAIRSQVHQFLRSEPTHAFGVEPHGVDQPPIVLDPTVWEKEGRERQMLWKVRTQDEEARCKRRDQKKWGTEPWTMPSFKRCKGRTPEIVPPRPPDGAGGLITVMDEGLRIALEKAGNVVAQAVTNLRGKLRKPK